MSHSIRPLSQVDFAVTSGESTIPRLDYLIIQSVRGVVTSRASGESLLTEYLYVFGNHQNALLAALGGFLTSLGRAARRPLEIFPAGTPALARDERQILNLLAAAQLDAETEGETLLEAHLRWTAKPEHRLELSHATRHFAKLLAAFGYRFFLPTPDA